MKIAKDKKNYTVTFNRKATDALGWYYIIYIVVFLINTLISRNFKRGKEPEKVFWFQIGDVKYIMKPKRTPTGNNRFAWIYPSLVEKPKDGVCNVDMYIDGLFMLLPEKLQQAVAAHELGHCVVAGAAPKAGSKYQLLRGLGICPREEILADSLTTQLFGKEMTRKMILVIFLSWPFSAIECLTRYLAVK